MGDRHWDDDGSRCVALPVAAAKVRLVKLHSITLHIRSAQGPTASRSLLRSVIPQNYKSTSTATSQELLYSDC